MEKRKFQALQKSLGIEGKILLDEVRSEVSSQGRSSCSSFSEDFCETDIPEIQAPSNADDSQKEFYAQFLTAKMSLSSRDPAQYVTASQLYKQAVQMNIQPRAWGSFIKQEIEAAREIYRHKKQRSFSPSKQQQHPRFASMSIIAEEEIG